MRLSLPNVLKTLVLASAGFVLAWVVLGSVFVSTLKNMALSKLGLGSTYALSANSCTAPTHKNNDVYFVSCGGFF